MIEAAIRSILLADPTVYGLVGTRIQPAPLPLDTTYPAISHLKVSDPYSRIVGRPRIQIDCWSTDWTECQTLAKAVESSLDGYSGIVNGVNIEIIVPLDYQDFYDNTTKIYQVAYDFKVIYRK
jgi:hypothetical protein